MKDCPFCKGTGKRPDPKPGTPASVEYVCKEKRK